MSVASVIGPPEKTSGVAASWTWTIFVVVEGAAPPQVSATES
jgi:hypothetical protein